MNKKIGIYSLLELFIIVGLFLLLRAGEKNEIFYTDFKAAQKAGVIVAGWIPNVIPESSVDIYGWYDLDTNAVRLKFKFDKRDINKLVAQIEEVKSNGIKIVEFPSPSSSWWPKELSRDLLIEGQSNLKLYKYKRILQFADHRQQTIPAFFVIDWNSSIAYYWQ